MFRIHFVTPAVLDERGTSRAAAQLEMGNERIQFLVNLDHWSVGSYEVQWRAGIERLVYGAESSALVTSYHGPEATSHRMCSLWRDGSDLYVQEVSVVPGELDAPFDPAAPYQHVGARVPASALDLPIAEYRQDLVSVFAAHFLPSFRWR